MQVEREQGLGVGLGGKALSPTPQLIAQCSVVVDLAVEDDHGAIVDIGHRWRAAVDIDDGKPCVAEGGMLREQGTATVRATMGDGVDHGCEAGLGRMAGASIGTSTVGQWPYIEPSGDAAHPVQAAPTASVWRGARG